MLVTLRGERVKESTGGASAPRLASRDFIRAVFN